MWIVAIAWMYVAVMMTVAEAMAPNGTLLGAFFTLVFYGVLPVMLVMYLLGTPARRRARRAAEAAEWAAQQAAEQAAQQAPQQVAALDAPNPADNSGSGAAPDQRGHASGDPITAERKEV